MSQITCKARALKWVHLYAAGGTTFAMLTPIPGATTAGLTAAETHMVYWIAKIYGEELSVKEIAITLGGLELAGLGLKAAAMEACTFIPIAGWIVKGVIAGGAIEGIGHVIVDHFEDRHPGKHYTVDPKVESSTRRR